jgi:hypothetical protein
MKKLVFAALTLVSSVSFAQLPPALHCAALAQGENAKWLAKAKWDVKVEDGPIPGGPPRPVDEFSISVQAISDPFDGESISAGISYSVKGNKHEAFTNGMGPFEGRNGDLVNLTVKDPDAKKQLMLVCAFGYVPEFTAPLVPPVVSPRR